MTFENSFNNYSKMTPYNLFKKRYWAKRFEKHFFTKDKKVLYFFKCKLFYVILISQYPK